jgi:DDE family transposase
LIDPVTRGDPESPLRGTCKSIRKRAEELKRRGHATRHRLVAELLHGRGDSLQANDGGGSNGSRGRLWKRELQRLASATGLRIAVGPFPPGTSKGTKIAPWLVSLLSPNWRGRPLVSHEGVVHLIAATTTERGLKVAWELDRTRLLQGSRSRRRPGRGSD